MDTEKIIGLPGGTFTFCCSWDVPSKEQTNKNIKRSNMTSWQSIIFQQEGGCQLQKQEKEASFHFQREKCLETREIASYRMFWHIRPGQISARRTTFNFAHFKGLVTVESCNCHDDAKNVVDIFVEVLFRFWRKLYKFFDQTALRPFKNQIPRKKSLIALFWSLFQVVSTQLKIRSRKRSLLFRRKTVIYGKR